MKADGPPRVEIKVDMSWGTKLDLLVMHIHSLDERRGEG